MAIGAEPRGVQKSFHYGCAVEQTLSFFCRLEVEFRAPLHTQHKSWSLVADCLRDVIAVGGVNYLDRLVAS